MKNSIIKLFNLEPKQLLSFDVYTIGTESFAMLTLQRKVHLCPHCHTPTKQIHDYQQRIITHAILDGIRVTIVYQRRRYYCALCQKSFVEENPFVSPGKRISRYTVLRIMTELKNPRLTFKLVADNCHVSDTTVRRVFDQYVGIPSHSLPSILCIDEVYTNKFRQRCYACVLFDFETSQIIDLLPRRNKDYLANYFSLIDPQLRDKVQYICMDMWLPYRDIAQLYFRKAKVCVDRFHLIRLVNYSFNKVRIRVMNQFHPSSEEYYLLKKYHWLLEKRYDQISLNHKTKLTRNVSHFSSLHVFSYQLINRMVDLAPELEIAYVIKEDFYAFLDKSGDEDIADNLDRFIAQVIVFNIAEFKNVSASFSLWRNEIINSFAYFDNRRISNGPIESCNSRIKLIKRNANGYPNFECFRKRVLYSLNKDSFIKF